MSIYDTLNPMQKEGVLTTEGPVLLLAGAGSGKTRVLTHRICYLIEEKGVNPYNILAITFTNKAAKEMRERVDKLVGGPAAAAVWVSTFHSMCVRILRRHIEELGYTSNFTIYDTDDVKTIIKGIMKRLNIDNKTFPERSVMSRISDCKNRLITEELFDKQACDYKEKKIAQIYLEYAKELKKNNALDFDDLLLKTVELFKTCPDILENYQKRFQYIHVDEYQDTNGVQFALVAMLADRFKNLCVVGDDDQSIYRFRGADIGNILSFEKHFPGAKVIKLEQNYRSTPNILEVANHIIKNNKGRKPKRLWSASAEGDAVEYRDFPDSRQEALGVVSDIAKHVNEGEEYKDIAILYRTNAQSRAFEEACILKNVPYRIVGGVNFYQRAEIKDLLAYLKTIDNGQDDLAVRRIINVPKRGVGQTSLEKIAVYANANDLSLYEALTRVDEIAGVGRAATGVHQFVNQIRVLRAKAEEMDVDELIEAIIDDVEYEGVLDKLDPDDAQTKKENIDEFINKAAEFSEEAEEEGRELLNSFLEEVALIADIDSMEEGENRVLLMTLHGSKGLEFPRVYLCGMEEELFPSAMAIVSGDPQDIEEERRLCYVGVTRAMKHLTLTSASLRMVHGESYFHSPSRFLREVPDGLLKRSGNGQPGQLNRFANNQPGQQNGYSYNQSGQQNRYSYGQTGRQNQFSGSQSNRFSGNQASSGSGQSGMKFGGFSSYNGSGSGNNMRRESQTHTNKPFGNSYSQKQPITGTNPGFGKDVASLSKVKPDYQEGDRVVHSKYGAGTVLEITDSPRDYMVKVEFDDGETRKMLAGFAKLVLENSNS